MADATTPDGPLHEYFIKVQAAPRGPIMCDTEFHATAELHAHAPEMVAMPVAVGEYDAPPPPASPGDPPLLLDRPSFYLTRFRRLARGIPTAPRLARAIFNLHERSEQDSRRTGRTAFGCTATPDHCLHAGPLSLYSPPSDSWTEAFTMLLRDLFAKDDAIHGHLAGVSPAPPGRESREASAEMAYLHAETLERVVPRLLGALERSATPPVPTLVHGDLWDANSGVDLDTNAVVIYDSVSIWAHREYEFGPWMAARHRLTYEGMVDEYLKLYTPCAPAEDFADRLQLYWA
jgi:hypothetical protein